VSGRRHLDPAVGPTLIGVGLACWGWGVGNALLAIAGVLIALVSLLVWVWGRWCLAEVSFERRLDQSRASFGDVVCMELEIVNDKVLPLAWLHVRDGAPPGLDVEGSRPAGWRRELHVVVAMLPYQRLRRHVTIVCNERGEHRFGPATLRSGSPAGTHERRVEVPSEHSLLVYPKVVPLSTTPLTSRVPLGERRVRQSVALDPTRVVGVRPYTTGDPVRTVDWRASARSADVDLLVRVHEPAATPSVAVFAELLPARGVNRTAGAEMVELLVSVTASVVSQLLSEGIPTGLYTTGMSLGVPVALPPSRDPGMRATMLEALAYVSPRGGVPIADALVRTRHRMGVSVLLIAADFLPTTCAAMAEVHRRSSVGAIWVKPPTLRRASSADAAGGGATAATTAAAAASGSSPSRAPAPTPTAGPAPTKRSPAAPPPRQLVDATWHVAADEKWREWSILKLVER
jgi:uncharacterized protein (DUF58 family)